jgi:hypothetical protein
MSNKIVYIAMAMFLVAFWGTILYIAWKFSEVVIPAQTDEHCPYCYGIGYDSSGFTCTCVREKQA